MSTSIDAHMRQSDALMWSLERSPELRATIVLVALLDGSPSTPALTDRLERLSRVAPTFRQRVIEEKHHITTPMLAVDPHFDVNWHLRRFAAAEPRTLESVLREAAKLGTEAFDPVRPLWECTVVDGMEGGQSALVVKVHHTLTDGLGGVQLLSHLLDLDPASARPGAMPTLPPPVNPPSGSVSEALGYAGRQMVGASRSVAAKLIRTAFSAARDPVATTRDGAATARAIFDVLRPPPSSMSPVFCERGIDRRYMVIDVPTAALKAAGHSAGGTLNDAFIAALTGGLRIYHERHGQQVQQLSGVVPVSVRTAEDPLAGNRITSARYVDKVEGHNPAERIRAAHARMRRLRNDRATPYLEAISAVVNRLPTAYLQGATAMSDFMASNVPGIPVPVYCAGAPVRALYPFGPTIGAPLNVTLMSYADTCHIGVNIDVTAVPDSDEMRSCLQAGLAEVLELADSPRPVAATSSPGNANPPKAARGSAAQVTDQPARKHSKPTSTRSERP